MHTFSLFLSAFLKLVCYALYFNVYKYMYRYMYMYVHMAYTLKYCMKRATLYTIRIKGKWNRPPHQIDLNTKSTCTFLTQIFIYFSKPLRLLYSLIVYVIVNFLSSLFTLCYFFLSFCSIHVIVHVHVHVYV